MGAGGSISAMISSLKNNKIPTRERSSPTYKAKMGQPLIFKNKMNSTELKQFSSHLKAQKRKKTITTIVITVIVFSLLFGISHEYLL
ncbi:hypothetical protein [Crocinitomix algicola]|uniref:hypothetical protein n=1 Tax=Crocinitomix algicola TaxID=1740263 RepID=UPI000872C354|nr:hypothetical protein [Crocinitomix algicola]